jgi:hypothetical protein
MIPAIGRKRERPGTPNTDWDSSEEWELDAL